MERTENVGIIFPEILIPESKTNLKKWAVIACDQYTSDEDYWIRVSKTVGGAPSTLHIIVPEAFLKNKDISERIGHAKATMTNFIEDGILVRLPRGVVLVERETPYGTRIGVMLAVDLEKYDVDHTKKPLIRATEQTVVDRLPPRVKLREASILECPHIMLVIDDIKNTVLGPVYEHRKDAVQLYDTPLMMDGGNVKGWFIDDENVLEGIVGALERLKDRSQDGILFAVGDGNHSLASAKAVWESRKEMLSEEELETSPLRYALVEVVNLYDNGLSMLPIHRMLFNVEPSTALRTLVSVLNGMGTEARMMYTKGGRTPVKPGVQIINFESKMSKGRIELAKPQHELVGVTLTLALDKVLDEMPKAEIDYIHGDEEFHELAGEHGTLGFLMEPMVKEELFESVIEYGVLPRKSFSLGLPEEKRYYFECRLLVDARAAQDTDEEDEPYDDEFAYDETEQGVEPEETDGGFTEAGQAYDDQYTDEGENYIPKAEDAGEEYPEDDHPVNKRKQRKAQKAEEKQAKKRRMREAGEEDEYVSDIRRPRYEDEEDGYEAGNGRQPKYADEEDEYASDIRRPRYEDEEDGYEAGNGRQPKYADEEDEYASDIRRPGYEDEEDGYEAGNGRQPKYADEEGGHVSKRKQPKYADEEDRHAGKRKQPKYIDDEDEYEADGSNRLKAPDEEEYDDDFDFFSDESMRAPRRKGRGLFGRRKR